MRFSSLILSFTVLAGLLCFRDTLPSHAMQLTEVEKRGRQIYLETVSPSSAEIKAFLTNQSFEAPGSAVACVNCHGQDGRGLDEGGVASSNITWEELTKSYGIRRAKGREHPAYDEKSVAVAISEGIDPAGNKLDPVMPRYQMSPRDMQDLVGFIKRLGSILDPGISSTEIVVGTIIPNEGYLARVGQSMKAVMDAYFSEVNKKGGIYSRKIVLKAFEYNGDSSNGISVAEGLLKDEGEVFALVSPFSLQGEEKIASLAESAKVPVIGPFTLFPVDITSLYRFTFYLFPGMREQVKALMIYHSRKSKGADQRVAVVMPEAGLPEDLKGAIQEQAQSLGWSSVEFLTYTRETFEPSQLVAGLRTSQPHAVFFLGSWPEFKALSKDLKNFTSMPSLFMPGFLAQGDIFEMPLVFDNRIFLSYPTLPFDQTSAGREEFNSLAREYQLSQGHLAAQISALCASKILVEGLKRTGKNLSREGLVSMLEKLYEFDTGLTPRISYDPNRRIGAFGAHVMRVDLQSKTFVPEGSWVGLN